MGGNGQISYNPSFFADKDMEAIKDIVVSHNPSFSTFASTAHESTSAIDPPSLSKTSMPAWMVTLPPFLYGYYSSFVVINILIL